MDSHSDAARPRTIRPHRVDDLCVVAPDPELNEQLKEQFQRLREQVRDQELGTLADHLTLKAPDHVGFDDGLIFPGTYFPTGTTAAVAQRAALDRAPLRGDVRVVVVLVDFSDKTMAADADDRFSRLFFSHGELPDGSVTEYFSDVSGGLVTITGEVVGPYRMPGTLASYAGSANGTQATTPNARTMANDALSAANADVDFGPYDNDGNGFVDAFIVVHAGRGAEQTGQATDIWSHKWVLPAERTVDGTKVFAYLTIPEDAKIGVSAHEIGHLIFGWPDLYDTDGTSEGVGNWCLMGGGSWGGGGDRPTHPSAWCKLTQGWASVVVQSTNATVTINDIKTGRTAYRLWKDGLGGNEYFLVENRQRTGYDQSLPGAGLLVWHIDEAVTGNTNESHYKVGLLQADGSRHLELNTNRGDAGDPFPGSSGNTTFNDSSTPSSTSFAGASTCVEISAIPASSAAMTVQLKVRCFTAPKLREAKDIKDIRDGWKRWPDVDVKPMKDLRDGKPIKDLRDDRGKGLKDVRDGKGLREEKFPDNKFGEKFAERPFGRRQWWSSAPDPAAESVGDLEGRLDALETAVHGLLESLGGSGPDEGWSEGAEPFIGEAERPDLGRSSGGPDPDALRSAVEEGSTGAKAEFDTLPPG
ncbi:M6 family metalloprotease domain-containing protein [Janibacter terrae]|uniref:M6 family metalloprotease domain-containing protein n=1 Tax=Janibacter terrae TaxID=103817 RepID=UPI0009EF4B34|nr:M6 family metalloprotease domain-containing protein [Janibacter terrae]